MALPLLATLLLTTAADDTCVDNDECLQHHSYPYGGAGWFGTPESCSGAKNSAQAPCGSGISSGIDPIPWWIGCCPQSCPSAGTGICPSFDSHVSNIAGSAVGAADGTGTSASFGYPVSIAIAPDGEYVLVGDYNYGNIRKVMVQSGEVTSLTSKGTWTPATAEGVGTNAVFKKPNALSLVDEGRILFVMDYINSYGRCVLSRMDFPSLLVTTVAGSSLGTIDGVGTNARFDTATTSGIAATEDGTTVYASQNNGAVRKVNVATGEVTSLLTTGWGNGGVTGNIRVTALSPIFGIAATPDGSFLYATSGSDGLAGHYVSRIDTSTAEVTRVAGSNSYQGRQNGIGTNARFNTPYGIALAESTLFVAEYINGLIRQIDITTGEVTTLAGGSVSATLTASTPGYLARFHQIRGLAVTPNGMQLISCERQTGNIRLILPHGPIALTSAPTPTSGGGNGDPHMFGLHKGRYDYRGKNNTIYCSFSSRSLVANVLFMHDTFLLGPTCEACETKVVQGSFMKVWTCPSWPLSMHTPTISPQHWTSPHSTCSLSRPQTVP